MYNFDDSKLKELYINKMPRSLNEAVVALLEDELICNALGKEALATFVATSKADVKEYGKIVTDWELKRYLIRS